MEQNNMANRKPTDKVKVTYRAFDQLHEDVFPKNMELGDFFNHMRGICNTWVLIDAQPTTKDVTINYLNSDND